MTRKTVSPFAAVTLAALMLAHGASAQAQAQAPAQGLPVPVPVPVPLPVPLPVPTQNVAQSPETLSARTLVRLEQLTRELGETIGRVEALEGAMDAQKAETERLITLMDLTRAGQSSPNISAEASSNANNNVTAKMSSEAAQSVHATEPAPASASASAPASVTANTDMFVAPVPPALSPEIMLINARTALQTGSYLVAESNLSQLIWVYPASSEASEGRWLLGEARFVQSSWGPAAQAYVDYLKASPQGPRASEALLRLAGTFRQLGDNRQRCVALAEFKRRAPRPDATLKARADGEIARMTCPTA